MRMLLWLAFLIGASLPGVVRAQSVAGEWDAQINTPGGVRPFKILFTVSGDTLTGTVKRPAGDVPLSGTIKGNLVRFSYTINYNGNELTLTIAATVTGDTMKGTVDFDGAGEDEFSAARARVVMPALGAREALTASLFVLCAGVAGWRLWNIYSPRSSDDGFIPTTREFLRAGLAGDSSALVRVSASPEAVAWALATGRQHPEILRDLSRDLQVLMSRRIGDGTSVLFSGWSFGVCANHPLAVTFSGTGSAARIREVSSDCRTPGPH